MHEAGEHASTEVPPWVVAVMLLAIAVIAAVGCVS